jgi:lipopolysaccharide transport system ATP-binding protein
LSDIAISIEHLSKYYRLGVINNGMLYKDIQSWMARRLGRPDPHAEIGSDRYSDADDGFWALKDLTLDVKQGDRLAIIGRNGAGKSTLLKILSRITAPTEGIVKIRGKVASLLEVGTGFHSELTGRENVFLNGAIMGMKKYEIARKMDEIVDFSGIENHIDTPVKRYSSGMYVRLAFSVAAHLDSDILIADEVLAVGDASFQKKALGKMQELSTGSGRTILFVSHQMNAVKNLCSSGLVLEKGRIKERSEDIIEVVNSYLYGLVDGSKESNRLIWDNDGSLCDKYFTPISFGLRRMGGAEKTINAWENLVLILEFECAEVSPNLTYEFYIVSMDTNNPVFSFSPFYTIEGYKPKIGKNKVSCKLPTDLLNDKQYSIELRASLFCERWILEPGKTSPTIIFTVGKKRSLNPFVRYSAEEVAPVVEWMDEA